MSSVDSETTAATKTSSAPVGLRGWLLLPLINLIVSLPIQAFTVLQDLSIVRVLGGTSEPDALSPAYAAAWQPYFLYHACFGMLLIAATVVILVFFFRRHRLTPRLMIGLFVLLFLAAVGEAIWVASINSSGPPIADIGVERSVLAKLGVTGLSGFVWGVYFMVSDRVRNTFTR